MKKKLCRISGEELTPVINFGPQPLGNGFLDDPNSKEYFFDMELGFSEKSKMLQLVSQPLPDQMFHDHYAFFSSTSSYMINHFEKFAISIMNLECLSKPDPFVVELGCNDGIMLKNFSDKGIRHLGIEPSLNVAKVANSKGVKTISQFFNKELANEIVSKYGPVDAFIAANVMCHIPNILDVVAGIKALLSHKGIVAFEDPYLGDIFNKNSYDQIYDEHVFLFSALSISYLFGLFEMELIDVQPQITHGGSMRYILSHKSAYPVNDSVNRLVAAELEQGLDKYETFDKLRINIEKSKVDLQNLLNDLKSKGKRVAGYAATSKSTTILNYCNIGPDLIEYICDTTPIKHNKYSPGMHVPIVPYDFFKSNKPDYAFLFAWNHKEEILQKEINFMKNGGKWITHVPFVQVL